MSKWQIVSIILGGLLVLSCVALGVIGVFWFVGAGGANALAAMNGQASLMTPTAAAPVDTATPTPAAIPPNGGRNGVRPQGAGVFGIVSSVSGSQVTVTGAKGISRTLTFGAQTQLIVVGQQNATVSDIKPGDKLLVLGLRNGLNSLEPRAVIDVPASYNPSNIRTGQIQSVAGQTLELVTARGTVTVNLDAGTQIFAQTLQPLQASALSTGNPVIVIGQPNADGSLNAQLIIGRATPAALRGKNANPPLPTATPSQ
jgi:uncharacterized protein DUF5666